MKRDNYYVYTVQLMYRENENTATYIFQVQGFN